MTSGTGDTVTPPTTWWARAARDGTLYIVGGALVAALFNYLFQLVGGRGLGSDEFAPIGVLWTVQFLAITIVLIPIEQTIVRHLAIAPDHRLRDDVPLIAGVVGSTAVALMAALWLTRDTFLAGEPLHAVQAGLIVVGYGVFATGRGAMGGRNRFRSYGISTAADSSLRLAVAVVLVALTATSAGLGWAMVVAPWSVLAVRPFTRRRDRAARAPEPAETLGGASGFLAAFIVANAASNAVLAAGPLVVGMLGGDEAAISAFFVTLIVVRAPLAFSYGLLSRILAPMARMVGRGESARLGGWGVRIVTAGVVLLPPAWFAGRLIVPSVIELLFGSEFRPSATLGGLIAVGVVAAMTSLVTGQILVARGQTSRLALAWSAALAVAVLAVLVSTGDPEIRVGIGFTAGELTALAGIAIIGIAAPSRAARSPAPSAKRPETGSKSAGAGR